MLKDTERVLIILHALLEKPQSPQDLLRKLDQAGGQVVPDTLYRDIRILRKHGYVIPKATRRTQGKYCLEHLPFSLPLNSQDIQALKQAAEMLYSQHSPQFQALQQTLTKLSFFLHPDHNGTLQKLKLGPSQTEISREVLNQLEALCQSGHQVSVPYLSAQGHFRLITLEPSEVAYLDHHWYLIGYDTDKQIWLELRVERIQAEITRLPMRKPQRKRSKVKALFRLYPHLSEHYQLRHDEQAQPDPEKQGCLLVTTTYDSELRFCQRILRYEQYAEILEPPRLRQRMQGVISELQSHYSVNT